MMTAHHVRLASVDFCSQDAQHFWLVSLSGVPVQDAGVVDSVAVLSSSLFAGAHQSGLWLFISQQCSPCLAGER